MTYLGTQPQFSTPPLSVLVTEFAHVVRIRDGRASEPLKPGRHKFKRRRDLMWSESALPQVYTIPSQEIVTSDGATVRATVSTVVAIEAPLTTMKVADWRQQWHLDVQLALRQAISAVALEDLFGDRADLDDSLKQSLTTRAEALGLAVEEIALRDVVAVGDLKRLLADVVAARLEGEAALERARGETAALRNLANAASLLKDNPNLLKLRLVQEIASSSGNTFVIDTAIPKVGD